MTIFNHFNKNHTKRNSGIKILIMCFALISIPVITQGVINQHISGIIATDASANSKHEQVLAKFITAAESVNSVTEALLFHPAMHEADRENPTDETSENTALANYYCIAGTLTGICIVLFVLVHNIFFNN